ncbi:hypothetical protein [Marilutibacter spongiae]|uniref:Uncharacterized protein n=1 Tax=Marilutibacter spongiae TaxID=2025720 RepID=A0A7W3TJ64_9GAMM|nr:hypothetical protein [Lysobacter spongiae]MBB1059291.1 hypothetical protein [Lysobacter spongiae]
MSRIAMDGVSAGASARIWSCVLALLGVGFSGWSLYPDPHAPGIAWHALCVGLGFLCLARQAWRTPLGLRGLLRPGVRVDYPPTRADLAGLAGLLLLSAGLILGLVR